MSIFIYLTLRKSIKIFQPLNGMRLRLRNRRLMIGRRNYWMHRDREDRKIEESDRNKKEKKECKKDKKE